MLGYCGCVLVCLGACFGLLWFVSDVPGVGAGDGEDVCLGVSLFVCVWVYLSGCFWGVFECVLGVFWVYVWVFTCVWVWVFGCVFGGLGGVFGCLVGCVHSWSGVCFGCSIVFGRVLVVEVVCSVCLGGCSVCLGVFWCSRGGGFEGVWVCVGLFGCVLVFVFENKPGCMFGGVWV